MEEKVITFETAKLAKEKGFNEIVNNIYDLYGRTIRENEITPYQIIIH